MEKAMAPHSSTLAWKIPWTEEPDGLQSMGSLRVGHDWATSLYFSLSCIGEGNGNPLQCSCLENPRDGGPWWAAVSGVAQSRTRLKWLRSSSSRTKVAAIVLAFPRWSQSGCCSSSRHICISDRKKGSMVSIRRRIFQKFVADFISHWIWTVKHSCA